MSSQGLPTLELDAHSRRAKAFVAILFTALAASASWLLVELLAGALTLSAVALSLAVAVVVPVGFWRAGWIGRQRQIIRIVWQADGRWFLTNARGGTVEAALRADTRISKRAIWLRWDIQLDCPGPWASIPLRSMLLVTGDLPDPDLRRLFVRLRIDRSRPAAQLPTMPTS